MELWHSKLISYSWEASGWVVCVCRGSAWRHSLNCGTNSNEGSPLYLTLEAWLVTGPRNGPCNCSRAKSPQKSRNYKPSLFLHEFTYGPGGQFDRGFNKYSLEVCQILKRSARARPLSSIFWWWSWPAPWMQPSHVRTLTSSPRIDHRKVNNLWRNLQKICQIFKNRLRVLCYRHYRHTFLQIAVTWPT